MSEQTHRQRLGNAIDGQMVDRIPIACRLDIWYRARQVNNDFPPGIADLSLEQLQLKLGMAISARKAKVFNPRFREPVCYRTSRTGLMLHDICDTPLGSLRRVSQYGPGAEKYGLSPGIVEYPIKSHEDYRIYQSIVEHLEFIPNYQAYREYDKAIGDNGLPMVILGPCAAHELMIKWVGYQEAFFHMADEPAAFESAVATGDQAYHQMWNIVADSPCELVMHGVNFDSQMTPPNLFEKFFLPYLRGFNQAMHESGKKVAFHGDGNLSELLDLIVEAGFDVADCLACWPMVPLSLKRAIEAWRGRIAIWGAIPSPLLEATTSDDEFRSHLKELLNAATPGDGFIVGLSDQAMPAALYERISWLSRFFLEHGKCPIPVETTKPA